MKPHEMLRIEPIFCLYGTGLQTGGAMGATVGGGAVNITKGVGEYFTVLVGCQIQCTASVAPATAGGTAANSIPFAVFEATAATHAGSAITGATITLGAATAGQLRGLYDAFYVVASDLTSAVNVNLNGIDYHNTAAGAGRDGSVVAAELGSAIKGYSGHAGHTKLPHYGVEGVATGFANTTGVLYIAPDDDQATGLTVLMSAVTDTAIPRMNKLQGKICINAHALSTNTPKWLNVTVTPFVGTTGAYYAFLLRDSGSPTPGALVTLNT